MGYTTIFQDQYPEVYIQTDDDTYKEVAHESQIYPEVVKEDSDTFKFTVAQGADGIQVHEPKKQAWYRRRWILGLIAITVIIIAIVATIGGLLGSRKNIPEGSGMPPVFSLCLVTHTNSTVSI